MNYKKVIKKIAVVHTVRVTNHSCRAHMSSSLHSLCTRSQSQVRSCLSFLHEGTSCAEGSEVLQKCCQFPEQLGLPDQSQRSAEMLPTAEKNVETCNRKGGIALGIYYICSIEESRWKVCREKSLKCSFPPWMHVRYFWLKVVLSGRAPVPSRQLHTKKLPSIIIITAACLLQEGACLYLGDFLYLLYNNQCFAQP